MAVILVVDDDPDVRELLTHDLETGGHVVASAGDAESGLKLYQERQFDAVVLDMWMPPGEGGAEFLRRAKAMQGRAKFLVVSGGDRRRSPMNSEMIARGFGADGFLMKGFDRVSLLTAVSQLVPADVETAPSGA